ncbi:MAG TPA: tetratricopeptide repeat protein, partial [Gammaproteobacteria bacterium]|nr:tetratricopeptide repeat protein [Gammaproteobacteria bacterium]
MKRMMVVVSKSFLPILLVFAAIYAGILSVHLSALSDAEKVTVIQVGISDVSEWADKTGDIGQELDAYRDPVYLKGIELLATEKYADVEQQVTLLATAGNSQLSQLLSARLSYAQKQYDQAKILFDKLLATSQPPMSAYFYRALTLDKLKQPQLAMADYDQVILVNPNHYPAHFNRAGVAMDLGNTAQAIVDLKKAAGLAGGDRRAKALLKLAQAYQKTRQENLVKATLEETIRFYPASVSARLELAQWYERDGQPDAAIHEYDLARDMMPTAASSYVQLARAYLKYKRVQSAEQAFRSALQLHPGYAPAQFDLADMLVHQGREQEAMELLNALLEQDPDNSRAYFQLGRIHSSQKHYVEALRYYQKVLSLNQNTSPETWLNIGLVYSA